MNFHVSRGKWIVCQIYFRRSKHSVDCATIDHIFFFASETVRSAVVTGTFVYVPTAVVSKVGNDSLVMVPLVRPVLGIQCLRRQVFD